MFGSAILEVTMGLVFVYLLYSLLATTINEMLASIFNSRSSMLEKSIKRMLDDGASPVLKNDFYCTPLIRYQSNSDNRKPSYLQPRNFSQGLIDVLSKGASDAAKGQELLNFIQSRLETYKIKKDDKGVVTNIESETIEYMQSMLVKAEGDIENFKNALETWFQDTMERVSGWYKRKTQLFLFIIGLALAVSFNIDSLSIVRILSKDDNIRKNMATAAVNYSNQANKNAVKLKDSSESFEKKISSLDKSYTQATEANKVMGLGWENGFFSLSPHQNWYCIVGWILTALAISLGAPFWFDMLNKIVNIRGSGSNPVETNAKKPKKA